MVKTKEQIPGFDLTIFQDTDLFRSSVDSLFLAHWVAIRPQQKLVDLCSGCGVIGLCLAKKFQCPTVLIEIQEALARLGQEAINYNHLQDQVQLINSNLKLALNYLEHDSVDVITCNPPYFSAMASPQLGQSNSQNIARHELYFDLPLLGKISSRLLKDNGCLYLVYRPDRLLELAQVLQEYHLPIKELRFIYPHQNDRANLVLIKCRKTMRTNGLRVQPGLVTYQADGTYTQEVRDFLHVPTK
ncbi:methyltransferase [Lactobacillus sp. DCY120]|uniref:Methyltransferase n=1 Tax=Bombilactobacillus apium TaxID=2675299 RepID=A0A850R1M5_9LACO|nr:methyltransferase [Bombilactobacillus apium]NVY97019.1 methyltransferase [Bombilactobacillus apium]